MSRKYTFHDSDKLYFIFLRHGTVSFVLKEEDCKYSNAGILACLSPDRAWLPASRD